MEKYEKCLEILLRGWGDTKRIDHSYLEKGPCGMNVGSIRLEQIDTVNEDELERDKIVTALNSAEESVVLSQLEKLISWTSNDGLSGRLRDLRLTPNLLKLLNHSEEAIVDKAAATMSYMSGRSAAGPYCRPWTFTTHFTDTSIAPTLHTLSIMEPAYSSGAELGWKTWNAAIVLVQFLGASPLDTFVGKDVLELGCGTGLSGIFCAKFGARSVLMTDYNLKVLETVQENVVRNGLTNVSVKRLDWVEIQKQSDRISNVESDEMEKEAKYDTIVGSDIVYDPDHAFVVPAVLNRLLAFNEHSRAYICIGPRPEAPRFMNVMVQDYGFEVVTHKEDFFEDAAGNSFHHDLLVYKRSSASLLSHCDK